MVSTVFEQIERDRTFHWESQLHKCAMCREPIEDDVYYVLERSRYCPECAAKWLERRKHRNERL